MSLAIIDYAMGNVHSVATAIKKVSPLTKINITNKLKKGLFKFNKTNKL